MAKSEKLTWDRSECIFSPCRTWRYTLERWWGQGDYVNFICLNPSTADEEHNDPTVTRCCHYAKRWGYAGCVVTNLFGLRSTDPQALLVERDPVGPENDGHIWHMAETAHLVVAAWGVWGRLEDRGRAVATNLIRMGAALHALGVTKEGYPRHPLYLRADAREKSGQAPKSGLTAERLDSISYRAVSVGFPLFTLGGLVFGMVWAYKAWGTYWSWDPKETWSLITWFMYAAFLHARFTAGWRGKKAAVMAIVGFGFVIFTYFGVNYLLSGLHSYA